MDTTSNFKEGFESGLKNGSTEPFGFLETVFPNPLISDAEAEEQKEAYRLGYEAGIDERERNGIKPWE